MQLSAFEVRSEVDNSYGALDSNSLAAFRMDLAKAPATAEVFTQAFMDDIAATSLEEVLTGYAGTVTASSSVAARNEAGAASGAISSTPTSMLFAPLCTRHQRTTPTLHWPTILLR